MNTLEKSKYMTQVTEYMETKKVYTIFEDLYRYLAIEQPLDPLSSLIHRLKTTRRFLTRKTYFRDRSSRLLHQRNNSKTQPTLRLHDHLNRRSSQKRNRQENRTWQTNRGILDPAYLRP